jgi:hypothetical protein
MQLHLSISSPGFRGQIFRHTMNLRIGGHQPLFLLEIFKIESYLSNLLLDYYLSVTIRRIFQQNAWLFHVNVK